MVEPESSEHRYTEEPSDKAWINAIVREVEGYETTQGIIVRDCGSRRWYDLSGWVHLEDAREEQKKLDAAKPKNNPRCYEYMCIHGIFYERWSPRVEEAISTHTVVDGHECNFMRVGWKLVGSDGSQTAPG